jgi:ADP-glucose pyrophosphorylase
MDDVHVQRGAKLRRVIVDRYNTIEAGARIGYDAEADARRYTVSPGGIVVVPRAQSGGVPFSPVFAPRITDPNRPALLQ